MDKERHEVLEKITEDVNIGFSVKTIANIFYHNISAIHTPNTYNRYHVRDFLILCRIDALYDKKLINDETKKELLELFKIYKEINEEINNLAVKAYIDDRVFESEEYNRLSVIIEHIESIFNKYHLIDELDLENILLTMAQVDENDINLSDEINKLRR